MKFRVSQWLDTSNKEAHEFPVVYGIQANNGNGWQHAAENGQALMFDTAKAAALKIKELRKRYPANQVSSK